MSCHCNYVSGNNINFYSSTWKMPTISYIEKMYQHILTEYPFYIYMQYIIGSPWSAPPDVDTDSSPDDSWWGESISSHQSPGSGYTVKNNH